MSRCKACNNKMTDMELCRKTLSAVTGKMEYAELCTKCLQEPDEWVDYYKRMKPNRDDDDFSYHSS